MKGEDKGWDYLAKLHKNVSQYTKSGSAAGQLAGRGEVAIGIVFLHDAVMYAEEGFPVKPVAPADGTGYEIGGLSLIKGAPHMANAKKFIDWALTPSAQAIAKDFRSFQLQSNKKTPLPSVVVKHGMDFEHVKTIKYDFLWASQNRDRILKRWSEADLFQVPLIAEAARFENRRNRTGPLCCIMDACFRPESRRVPRSESWRTREYCTHPGVSGRRDRPARHSWRWFPSCRVGESPSCRREMDFPSRPWRSQTSNRSSGFWS